MSQPDIPEEASTTDGEVAAPITDRYGDVPLGVECAWPSELAR